MIKRDRLRKVVTTKVPDGSGGAAASYEFKDEIPAHVSIVTTNDDITQFGIKNEIVLHTVTNWKLENDRYGYDGKVFQLLRQIKNGREYYQTFKQIT